MPRNCASSTGFRRRLRELGGAALTGAALTGSLLLLFCAAGSGSAIAEQPSRLDTQLVDHAGAFPDPTTVANAIEQLYQHKHIRLWVVAVDNFSGLTYDQWSQQTLQLSSLGDNDALLAVAIEDREYAFIAPTSMSDSDSDRIRTETIEPALHSSDWDAAAIAAAQALDPPETEISPVAVGGVVGTIAAGGVGLALWSRRRRHQRATTGAEQANNIDPRDTQALATLPTDVLELLAKQELVDIDNAVRTSAEELDIARSEFGEVAVAPFDAALATARQALARAFELRKQLDDSTAESDSQRRGMLVEIISRCGIADEELDSKVEEFDSMRDLLINAESKLASLTQSSVAIAARLPSSAEALEDLRAKYPVGHLSPINTNVDLATERRGFAEARIAGARAAVSLPAGKQGAAVAEIRAAEAALTQAAALLDSIDTADSDISAAVASLPDAIVETRGDLAEALEVTSFGGTELATATQTATAALERAEAEQSTNPLGAFNSLNEADRVLDEAMTHALDAKAQSERLTAEFQRSYDQASSYVRSANDFINTRRGGVGAQARTLLGEAQRHLEQARLSSHPVAAINEAREAANYGAQSLQLAQRDVSDWETTNSRGRGSGAGAVLGGILLEGLIRGGVSAITSGSRGGFGRSAGSYGGSRGSRRHSGGGRF